MKMPEEIKKGLSMCALPDGPICKCVCCPYEVGPGCEQRMKIDALAYIQQLEAQVANPYRMATMKELAEYAQSIGLTDFCYEEDNHD